MGAGSLVAHSKQSLPVAGGVFFFGSIKAQHGGEIRKTRYLAK